MHQPFRYLRLWLALARFSLVRELAFRSNFLVKIFVEVLWLGILIAFYETVFARTDVVAEWSRYEYLFFLGFYFALGGLLETFFMENCNNFADLVRTGKADGLPVVIVRGLATAGEGTARELVMGAERDLFR